MAKSTLSGAHTAGIFADLTLDGPEIGTLVVIVDRARNLPNRKTMGKQDPYCAARLGKEAKKTETDKRGGQTPKWCEIYLYTHSITLTCFRDQEMRFTVHDSPDYYQLKVSIFNDDKKTELIGETWVALDQIVVPGGGTNDLWHGLNCKGRYAGDVRIELTYYDTRPKMEKEDRRQSAPVLGSRDQMTGIVGPRQPKQVTRRPLPVEPLPQTPPPASQNPSVSPQPQRWAESPDDYQHDEEPPPPPPPAHRSFPFTAPLNAGAPPNTNSSPLAQFQSNSPSNTTSSPLAQFQSNSSFQGYQPSVSPTTRKSVSPQPMPAEGLQPFGHPFSPDSYQEQITKAEAGRPIIGNNGRVIDPSDHLPVDTWAPEPEQNRRGPEPILRFRNSPQAAQTMPLAGSRPLNEARTQLVSNPLYAHNARNSSFDPSNRNYQLQYPRSSPGNIPPRGGRKEYWDDALSEQMWRIDIGSGRRRVHGP